MYSEGPSVQNASIDDYRYCMYVQRRYGKSYYFATRFFPPQLRHHVYALYAFVRIADQWVDEPSEQDGEKLARLLEDYEHDLKLALAGRKVSNPVLRAFAQTAKQFTIPESYMLDFLDAMRQDLFCSRYPTYQHLQRYMWGSAGVVGAMMLCLFGCHRHELIPYAVRMGEAMQMTNFLRDVGEDWKRGRIYLPQEDLQRFGVTEEDIASANISEKVKQLLQYEIQRTRSLYAEAEKGISLLPCEYQYPVKLASRLYARVLDHIEANGYDVFHQRAQTSIFEKIYIAWHCRKET